MIISSTTTGNNPAFGKFIKIKGHANHLEHFRKQLSQNSTKDFITLLTRHRNKKANLYIISGKDFSDFINLIGKELCLINFRKSPGKFLNKKPLTLNLYSANKKLKDKKLI